MLSDEKKDREQRAKGWILDLFYKMNKKAVKRADTGKKVLESAFSI